MKNFLFVAVLCSFAVILFTGCRGADKPPTPLAADQVGPEMQKAFATATPEVKDSVTKLGAAIQSKDYPAASIEIQFLFNMPVATKEQRAMTARAMMTVNNLLQEAQAQGDQKAAAAISLQRKMK